MLDKYGKPLSMKPEARRMRFNRCAKSGKGVPSELVSRFANPNLKESLYDQRKANGEDFYRVYLKELTEQITEKSMTNR